MTAVAVAFILCLASPEDAPKKRALVVGVNAYEKRGFRDLEFAERDAKELHAALRRLGFDARLLLGSGEGASAATKNGIEAAVASLVDGVRKQDVVLVFLAGHGQQLPSERPDRSEDAFYCPRDAELRTPSTMISLSWLTDEVLAKKGGKNLLLVDACRDTPDDPNRGSRGVQGKVVALPEDTAILFACRAGQVSRENRTFGGGHGLFTQAVLDGLAGKAAVDGRIDWAGLVGHVGRSMRGMQRDVPSGQMQEPISAGVVGHIDLGAVAAAAPATEITNSIGMKLRLIPAGEFMMGGDKYDNEKPKHRVRILKAFYLGKTEVTQGQWKAVMGTEPWKGMRYVKEGADHPATYVSWEDASEYCRKLSEKDGRTHRLPTEAEWEYACRSGTETEYGFGDDNASLGEYAWIDKNTFDINEKRAHEVGRKKPNAFGLHDMHGNVWEWCSDWYGEKYYSDSPSDDPQGPTSGAIRVDRGGSWGNSPASCRSAYRDGVQPSVRSSLLGFRVVRVP